ncbi:MAG TPA: GNAT family N-acetyltransferase [Naasia sp.]|jgi:RimJ/RimL family protein N-acetyltransferase
MIPQVLAGDRVLLDRPVKADIDAITAACQDPLFERFLSTPWPYERRHAEEFVREFVPGGWAADRELTWAIRRSGDPTLLGVIGHRRPASDIGYWLSSSARGSGLMTEAVTLVAGALFTEDPEAELIWECVAGNSASAAVARRCGFAFTRTGPALPASRDGGHPECWHGVLRLGMLRVPQPGWPAEATA